MENHPIPQDITGFQFKLIGDMTIKQFAYLAGGCILGWIFLTLPTPFVVKIPFVSIAVIIGFSLAFIPVMGRPMDVIVLNFVRSLLKPTQYIYQKTGGNLTPVAPPKQKKGGKKDSGAPSKTSPPIGLGTFPKLTAGISPHFTSKIPKNKLDEREMTFFETLSGLFAGVTPPHISITPHVITADSGQEEKKEKDLPAGRQVDVAKGDEGKISKYLEQEAEYIKQKLEQAKQTETKTQGKDYGDAHQKVTELENLLNETLSQKMTLEQKILDLQKTLDTRGKKVFTPGVANVVADKPRSQSIRQVPYGMGKSIGLPITPEDPNLVTGIVKDARDNPLPNILVEIKDLEGNPVRAFKTNGVGQFAAATALLNGVYTIEFEDPQGLHKFDTIEIKADGNIILPIEATSVDAREELRRSLFQEV